MKMQLEVEKKTDNIKNLWLETKRESINISHLRIFKAIIHNPSCLFEHGRWWQFGYQMVPRVAIRHMSQSRTLDDSLCVAINQYVSRFPVSSDCLCPYQCFIDGFCSDMFGVFSLLRIITQHWKVSCFLPKGSTRQWAASTTRHNLFSVVESPSPDTDQIMHWRIDPLITILFLNGDFTVRDNVLQHVTTSMPIIKGWQNKLHTESISKHDSKQPVRDILVSSNHFEIEYGDHSMRQQ